MKRTSSEPATSAATAKKPSTLNNIDGFTADSIPPHHYHLVWETLSKDMHRLPLPSDTEPVIIICNTLFLTSTWIENIPHVSLQRFVSKKDFSLKFLPSHSLISEREWNHLQCIRKKITESCKSLMFGNLLKKRIQLEILASSARPNLEMELDDINTILSTSLTEIMFMSLMGRIEDVLVC
ncbi:hypothetical protein AVEN_168325-1 [Araneus ventricosus]|uniref:Uncharacterized protein n=1 Tax=Araneus ventricosus TaxID=182803 RepID=A0A4Y2NHB1_ARAVE|nr:hypothetical protein AVEN_168325-1 [Araneus ventricosus]